MKRIAFFFLFFLLVVGCEEREAQKIDKPAWLVEKIQEMFPDGDCEGCRVQRWTYNEGLFFQIYCSHWSCSNCEVYYFNGEKVIWGDDIDPADFEASKHRPVIVWECGDDVEETGS